jgi:hypothetical protein
MVHGKKTVVKSYTDYLAAMDRKVLTDYEDLSARDAFGAIAVPGSYSGENWKDDSQLNITIDGVENKQVRLGTKVNDTNSKHLDYIWKQTGGKDTSPFVYAKPYSKLATTGNGTIYIRQTTGSWWPIKAEDNKKTHNDLLKGSLA